MAREIKNLVDEGFRISLVEKAFFDGDLEIPHGLEEITTNAYYSECKVALFGHTHRQHASHKSFSFQKGGLGRSRVCRIYQINDAI